jgi:WD40 repeat protein
MIQRNSARDFAELSEHNASVAEKAQAIAEAEAVLRATEEAKALELAAAAEDARATAEAEAVERAAAQKEAERQAEIALSRQLAAQSLSILDKEPDLALLLSVEAYKSADTFQARNGLFNALTENHNLIRYIDPPFSNISVISFSPNGEMIAAGGDGMVWLYDFKDGNLIRQLESEGGRIAQIAFSADGTQLVTGFQGGDIIVWDPIKGQIIEQVMSDCSFKVGDQQYGADYRGGKVVFSPDGEKLLFNVPFGICVWNFKQGESRVIHSEDVIQDRPSLSTISFRPDNKLLEFSYYNRGVRLWDLTDFKLVNQWSLSNTEFEDRMRSLSNYNWDLGIHPTLEIIVLGSNFWDHDNISLWDLEDGELILEQDIFPPGQVEVFSDSGVEFPKLDFNQNGDQLIYIGGGGAVLWDIQAALDSEDGWGESRPISGFVNFLDIAYSPKGESLATVTDDGDQILLLSISDDAAFFRFVETIDEFSSESYLFEMNPEGNIVISVNCSERALNSSACISSEVHLWKYVDNHLVERFNYDQSDRIKAVVFNSDGSLFASVGCMWEDWLEDRYCVQGEIQIWNVIDGVLVSTIASKDTGWESVDFSPDGEILAAGGCGALDEEAGCLGELSIWDVSSGEHLAQISDQTGYVVDVAFSPDGKMVATASCGYRSMYSLCSRGEIRLWNSIDYQLLRDSIYAHLAGIESLEFNQDGSVLATIGCGIFDDINIFTSYCGQAETSLWQMPDGKKIGQPINNFWGSYFTPDGKSLVDAYRFRLIDVNYQQLIGSISFPERSSIFNGWEEIKDIAFEEDGAVVIALVVAYEPEHQLLIRFRMDPFTWHNVACDMVGRNLDEDEWDLYFPSEPYRKTCPQWPDGDKRQELVVPEDKPSWRG